MAIQFSNATKYTGNRHGENALRALLIFRGLDFPIINTDAFERCS